MTRRGRIFQYRNMMNRRGEPVDIGRIVGTGPTQTTEWYPCRAIVRGFTPHQLVGTLVYGDRHAIVLYEDFVASGFPVALALNNKVRVRGRVMNIGSLDDNTIRDNGVLIAYDMKVSG